MWLTGLSCPDFQTGGPSSASWSRLSFPMRPGRVGRGCRTLTITRLPPEAQAEVSWPFLAQPQRANYYLFMPPVFPPCNKRLLNEVSTKCLHLSQAVKDLGSGVPPSNLASESIKWNDSEAVLKSHRDHIENKEVKQGLEITNAMKSICTIMKKTPDSHSGKPYILDITVKNINLSVAWPGVSYNLTWAASLSGVWGQLKNPQQLTVKHLQLALTQSHPETKTSQPPWRSGSCLDLASIDICHCQACRHTCPSVTNNCMSQNRMSHVQMWHLIRAGLYI